MSTPRRKISAPEPAETTLVTSTPRRSSPTVAEKRARFLAGLLPWFEKEEFQVGLPRADFAQNQGDLQPLVKAISTGLTFTGHAALLPFVGWLVHSGASAEEAAEVLAPYLEIADVVALNVQLAPTVMPVVFADRLTVDEIWERLEAFVGYAQGLAQLSMRIAFLGPLEAAYISPLLVFFSPKKYEQCWAELDGGIGNLMRYVLRVGCVDVTNTHVSWAAFCPDNAVYEMLKDTIEHLNGIGHKRVIFDDAVLAQVIASGKKAKAGCNT